MSGFVEANRPSGFGYQIQTCRVTSGGCQKTNGEPVSGLAGVYYAMRHNQTGERTGLFSDRDKTRR